MKLIHFVLIAEGLTGDSEVLFFSTKEKAKGYFHDLTEPLLAVCRANSLEEGDTFYSEDETNPNPKSWRFNSGEDDDLDKLLGDCNRYILCDSIEVADDVNAYLADFNEHVDDSTIEFVTLEKAKSIYEERITEGVQIAGDHHDITIDRTDKTTWEHEGNTMFSEETNPDGSVDAFFGYDIDCYWTVRYGLINPASENIERKIASLKTKLEKPNTVYVALDPKPFDLSDFGTGKSSILGVYFNEQDAINAVTDAMKAADMDVDEIGTELYVETHTIE